MIFVVLVSFIGGQHSNEMIKNYWFEIAENPKQILNTDFKLILQLLSKPSSSSSSSNNRYDDILFKLDQKINQPIIY